jgi:hypothetical protein
MRSVLLTAVQNILYLDNSANGTHCCVSMTTISNFLWYTCLDINRIHCYVYNASLSNLFCLFPVTHVAQQYTGDISALLMVTIFTRTCHNVKFINTVPNKNDRYIHFSPITVFLLT